MSKNLQCPNKLTEFAPLQQEEKPQTVTQFISKFFKANKTEESPNSETNCSSNEGLPSWADESVECGSVGVPNIYQVNINEGRSLPNVLKRISTLLALKTNSLQDYADTELKQYWMPDSVSKECYECSEKFTTFRRRHHCRVCGQIFCSQCCNQQIPGKIFGCTGDLRVCTYCCKIVLSYLQSANFDATLSADLKALQQNLQSKFGDSNIGISDDLSPNKPLSSSESNDCLKRKISVGYQEERFGSDGSPTSYLTNEEKCKALQNSISLRNLFDEICKTTTGVNFSPFKHRMRTYSDCFLGSELVDWLICQQKAKNRIQAAALSQALLEGNYIESFTEPSVFVDGYVRYRKGNSFSTNFTQLSPNCDVPTQEEPSWVQQISHDSSNSDSDTDTPLGPLPTSNSYTLDMNVEASSVYLCRPPESPYCVETPATEVQSCKHEETTVVRPSEQRELAPESGWFHASSLREENGEKEAYELLSDAYEQHEQSLLKQLLSANGLSISWSDILVPLIRDIICLIRPDKNHDAEELDIRNYVQIKKLPGGKKEDTYLVGGIVCSKNVAHREMSVEIDNPRILLLQCSVVYQRTEGRLMSLEPVMMQEHEYLRHVSARIAALKPDVVFVHKNISRLAQDMLRQYKITLVHNVKRSVMDRLSRCTEGDLVTAVDAHIGRPNLGTCKKFYLKTFPTEKGGSKTLMFFEGLMAPHLGATVLLRGTTKSELVRVKKVASFLIFAAYNWRLEKSFLMDEYALPPNSRIEFLEDSRESSPQTSKPKVSIDDIVDQQPSAITPSNKNEIIVQTSDNNRPSKNLKHSDEHKDLKLNTSSKPYEPFTDPLQSSEPKKITVESIVDNSDPLHSYSISTEPQVETLKVAELPFSNNFKKHLDDTILCISPYILFPMPYLETDGGRKCNLRRFFHKDMYYSEQFEVNTRNKWRIVEVELEKGSGDIKKKIETFHPFQQAKITNTDDPIVQNMLAHFRACGGQYKKKEILNIVEENKENHRVGSEKSRLDVLDPMNHQRLAVLFYSFSHESNNAPAFCVNPWVVYMDFYGRNDIPIGCFLEKYCFRSTYACPSKTCTTPMVKHVRRFVHNSGSVTITLNNFHSEFAEENIVMWSWCTKCQSVSPVVPLSADSWSYSFAKYLELRFHGEIFNRRGQSPCTHSLHHDHFHYFGYKNYVASFKYSSINIWEISLPPTVIEFTYDLNSLNSDLIEEAKLLAQKGHDVLAFIQEKAAGILLEELEGGMNVKQILAKELVSFKQKVEAIQLKLTSPSVEVKEFNEKALEQSYWKVQDNVTRIKATLVELVETWNQHLNEAIRKSDKKKEKNTVPELESPASEITEKFIFNAAKGASDLEKTESMDESLPKSHLESSIIADDSTDSKKEVFKKEKSVKNILDKLLPSSGQLNIIQSLFPPQDHYTLPTGVYGPIPVLETELSSIIAYALNSYEYKKSLEDLTNKKICNSNDQSPSPISKRKYNSERMTVEGDDKGSGLLGFLRNKDLVNSPTVMGQPDMTELEQNQAVPEKGEDHKKAKNSHVEVQFQDNTCNFFCRIYLADKFASLRNAVLPIGEEAYIRSLSRSIEWQARGGKSGSTFSKTLDDRFILKEMPKAEIQVFLESASNYFTYMQKCCATMQPTLLGKIVGIYQIIYKNTSNVTLRSCVLVMENLFYNRNVSQKFDLKGSVRNRLVVPDNQEGEIVLLDENLLKMTCDSPLYVLPHSKEVLLAAIQNDTEFLSTQSVMDYSLLVGLDTKNKELVLGIIDYIRTFTWDKRLETIVKKTGILGGQGKLPTIISPEEYQKRFIEAMHKYFLEVPDHYAGLGKGLDL
ncbi:1-phosphatidylinositol 3-phosphate 5-kinase [Anthonomus grandis grandis]|uniref:1-phosphatidylinositol 3-phosphate 5-kinase n=1 Tax=Anthonomus grandis grandis TaxID=2921223 RepID=UPI0021660B00|nr:1-phosphatidylinositol 3-phosphate 5-kinase [Anthonomus grandis grandis]